MEKTSTGVLSFFNILEAFTLPTVLAKAGESCVCDIFSFSLQANELMALYFLMFYLISVRMNSHSLRYKRLLSYYFFSYNSADGACRHTAAALFDLEATIRRNDLETCTSVSCLRVKRKRITENAVPMENVKFQKSEYGKISKDCPKPHDFNPLCSDNLSQPFQEKFYNTLLEAAPSSVALQFITKPPVQAVSEEELLDQITSADIDHEEIVEYAEVYSLKELADTFVAQNNCESLETPTYEHCSSLLEFLHHSEFVTEVIFQRTLSQSTSNSKFWFSQRAGRITASNFTGYAT